MKKLFFAMFLSVFLLQADYAFASTTTTNLGRRFDQDTHGYMQVKVFECVDGNTLQKMVNDWLATPGNRVVKIVTVLQSQSQGNFPKIVLTIFYYESKA